MYNALTSQRGGCKARTPAAGPRQDRHIVHQFFLEMSMLPDEEAIPLEGDEPATTPQPVSQVRPQVVQTPPPAARPAPASKIQAFGSAAMGRQASAVQFHRQPTLTGAGAVRCRLFNSKLSVAAMEHMVNSINEWLDANQIEVKHVAQVVGTMEGKTTQEPNLIVTIWY
jgi:hypothetical protein